MSSSQNNLPRVQNREPDRIRRRLLTLPAAALVASIPNRGWPQSGARLRDVSLSVPGPNSAVSIPMELAVKLGIDRAEGINLRLMFISGGIPIKDLESDDADFAVFGLPSAMSANTQQPRLVALAAIHDLPLFTLMVRSDLRGQLRNIADLKGCRIGLNSGLVDRKTTSHQVADLILSSAGVTPADVTYIQVGLSWDSQSSALISRTVDATLCDEPFGEQLAAEKLAFRLFSTAESRLPGFGFLRAALIARRDKVTANPEIVDRMVKMTARTLAVLASKRADELADILERRGAERSAFISAWKRYPRQFSHDARFSTAQLKETALFHRVTNAEVAAAQNYNIESMIVDRWSGRKP